MEGLPENTYTSVDENGWRLSIDTAENLGAGATERLDDLQRWLGENLRVIKLPDLLIEVDNELQFTRQFMTPGQQGQREADYMCQILVTIMAYGCNIGPYTMARHTDGVSYSEIRRITDWHSQRRKESAFSEHNFSNGYLGDSFQAKMVPNPPNNP